MLEEKGAQALNVADLGSATGIAPEEIRSRFGSLPGVTLALFERISGSLAQRLSEAYHSEPVWVDAVRATLSALLAELESRPETARFLIVGSMQGDVALLRRRERYLAEIARVIELDAPRPATEPLPPFGAEATVVAAASILHGRLLEDPTPSLRELCGPLMAVIAMPYLDVAATREELARAPASADTSPQGPIACKTVLHLGGSHQGAGRLTDRTAQVLQSIAENPNSSNTVIAELAGVGDQGQMSRLLARLRRLGLVEDRSDQRTYNAAKAWFISEAGKELLADLESTQQAD